MLLAVVALVLLASGSVVALAGFAAFGLALGAIGAVTLALLALPRR